MERIFKGDTIIIRWPFVDKNKVPFNLGLAGVTVDILQGINSKVTYIKGTSPQLRVDGGTLIIEITSALTNKLATAVCTVKVKLTGGDGEMAVQLGSANTFARHVFEIILFGEVVYREKIELPVTSTSFQIYPVSDGAAIVTEDGDVLITTEDGKIIII